MSLAREPTTNFSYMDGIPVKISEQYKPPRKVTLPVGFQHRLTYELLSEEYGFRLERSVLEKIGEWRVSRKAAVDSRKERIKVQDDICQEKLNEDLQKFSINTGGNITSTENSGSCPDPRVSSTISSCLAYPESISSSVLYTNATLNPNSNETFSDLETQDSRSNVSSLSSSNHNVQFSHRTSILTPVPFSQNSSNINSAKSSSQFNFSDFEADTSSPFDNMELKTINEMEELAHVLQPISNSPDSKECPGRSDVDITNNFPASSSYIVNQAKTYYNTIGSKAKKDSMILTHINGLSGYSSYNTAPRTKERESRGENYVASVHNIYNSPSNVPIDTRNVFNYYPHQPWNVNVNISHPSAYHSVGNTDSHTNVITNISTGDSLSGEGIAFTQPESRPAMNSIVSFPLNYNQQSIDEDPQTTGKSLSKSVPDIVQELEKELAVKRVAENSATVSRMSHTPPPRPNSFGSSGLEDWKPWPDLDSPDLTQPRNKKTVGKNVKQCERPVLPNPFHELSSTSQKLVKHISEMGFALSRVARACQLFGEDDKKVVEFLLQVQSLEEKNWPGDLAEKAIITNGNNIPEAVKFLEAFIQLLDLGFPEDKVSDALVRFQNDRDKALDHLIS